MRRRRRRKRRRLRIWLLVPAVLVIYILFGLFPRSETGIEAGEEYEILCESSEEDTERPEESSADADIPEESTADAESPEETPEAEKETEIPEEDAEHPEETPDPEREYESIEEAAAVLREGMVNRQEEITVRYTYTEEGLTADSAGEEVSELARSIAEEALVHTGRPDEGDYLKWQCGDSSISIQYTLAGDTCSLVITYSQTYYTTAEQEREFTDRLEEVMEELALDSLETDEQRIRSIYDYICEHVTYDREHLEDETYTRKYTAYAALIDGTSVCQGYATLFYRMALSAGFDARLITGTGSDGEHGWDIVKLGEYYYNVDPTWDAGRSEYRFFLRCDDNFEDHVRSDEYRTEAFCAAYPMSPSDYPPTGS